MQHNNQPPKKPHAHQHSALKAAPTQLDWSAADALNTIELRSLNLRGVSITPEEGREVTEAPRIVGDALRNLEPNMSPSSKRAPKLKGPE